MLSDISFNDVYLNFREHCQYFGDKATHHKKVNHLHHCNHPSKVDDNFNWGCTLNSCPWFEKHEHLHI